MTHDSSRFSFVDGLRGCAALLVVLFHFYEGTLSKPLSEWTPQVLATVFKHGYLGVQIFFVLSGYVIAHSLRDTVVTGAAAGRFALRRQIRLDPPYWVTIALVFLDRGLPNLLRRGAPNPLPGSEQTVAHFFYLQDLLGLGNILPVFWTLCIEVQFYLVFIGLLWAEYRLVRPDDGGDSSRWGPRLLAALGVVSLGAFILTAQNEPPGFFLKHWHLFVLGVLVYRHREQRASGALVLGYSAAVALVGVYLARPEPFTGLVTAGLLFAAPRVPAVARALGTRPLLYLGRISYSLYLIHYVAGFRVLNGGYQLTGDSRPWAVVWFLLAIAVSIVAAELLYRGVERPSVAFAARFKQRLEPVVQVSV